ncbi:hypothetical protein [Cellulomonas aerilata]|uniref:Uncharacterized protein n=1 Tax=Cellulomonas aerilata TaxID=515326 RepID=A0A512D8E0_9CELL|nr:hypothetical protein [Cellulomonas aerilata]GEO32677.1 hypothetical protein CAE01nite_04020 [Cellulomonas aerilata]
MNPHQPRSGVHDAASTGLSADGAEVRGAPSAWRTVARVGSRTAAASLVVLLAACSGAGGTVPATAEPARPQVAGAGSTPAVREPIVIPPAPTFADDPGPPASPEPTSPQGDALLPTGAAAAAWGTAELVGWAGQLDGFTLPADGTWRSLSIGLQFSADGGEELDGIEADLTVTTPAAVDDLVAQQVAGPPRGSTVLDVVEGEDDGRRAVSVVLHTPGDSADSVDVMAEPQGGSLVHVQHLPRRDGRRPALPEERVRGLVSRLTQGAEPDTWEVRFARLTLVDTHAPAVMVAWSVPGQDVAQAMAAAQAAFGHLTFEPVEINQFRSTSDFAYPAAATSGTVSVSTESDGTTRVELEARG